MLGSVGGEDFSHFKLLESYNRNVSDMLALIEDKCVSRDPDALRDTDFQRVRELVAKAIN